MTHIESRPSKTNPGSEYDFYVDYICSEEKRAELVDKLNGYAASVNILSRTPQKDEGDKMPSNTFMIEVLEALHLSLYFALDFPGWKCLSRHCMGYP